MPPRARVGKEIRLPNHEKIFDEIWHCTFAERQAEITARAI
jgi:hypothetical protein